MKVICSYCRELIGEKKPLENDRITHAMCSQCYTHFQRQLEGISLNEYLDDFDLPVLIVNGDGRMIASNSLAGDMLGKTESEIFGLLGGEAMECDFARLKEGCGGSVHCETCTIRNTVMQTMATGQTIKNARVKLRQAGRETEMIISAYFLDGIVQIVIGR